MLGQDHHATSQDEISMPGLDDFITRGHWNTWNLPPKTSTSTLNLEIITSSQDRPTRMSLPQQETTVPGQDCHARLEAFSLLDPAWEKTSSAKVKN
eukprot:g20841.t1